MTVWSHVNGPGPGLYALGVPSFTTDTVVAIEALCATQGLDLRAPLEASEATRAVTTAIRERVPTLTEDRPLAPDIAVVTEMVRGGVVVSAAEGVIGPLPWHVP